MPLTLIYYEACISQEDATKRERYFKTYHGRMFWKRRLKSYLTGWIFWRGSPNTSRSGLRLVEPTDRRGGSCYFRLDYSISFFLKSFLSGFTLWNCSTFQCITFIFFKWVMGSSTQVTLRILSKDLTSIKKGKYRQQSIGGLWNLSILRDALIKKMRQGERNTSRPTTGRCSWKRGSNLIS